MEKRVVFYVSDRTGLTTQAVGESLLTQFEGVEVKPCHFPYIDTLQKAQEVAELITETRMHSGVRPLVFCTLMDDQIREVIKHTDSFVMDYFDDLIGPLEEELGLLSSHVVGRAYSIRSDHLEKLRTDAINFSLIHDDGQSVADYHKADIILVGISRAGKTPVSLYLALKFGLFAANYPLTEEDFGSYQVPNALRGYEKRCAGLSVVPKRLSNIRQTRLPNSRYASLDQCREEYSWVIKFFEKHSIPYFDNSSVSIEEMATKVLQKMVLEPKFHI
jgi:[pyruvate, water dikinase]-phosphate phosphotransferase / [pyruvate, water dikinase] kinase